MQIFYLLLTKKILDPKNFNSKVLPFLKHKSLKRGLAIFAALFVIGITQQYADTIPIRLHPDNQHYFEFRGEPTVLVTSAEHYSSALNIDFDYVAYLDELEQKGLNYTRLFTGAFVYNVDNTPLTPAPGSLITPWARSDEDGYRGGGNKFDLDTWDTDYFERLHDIVGKASAKGIVIEITFYCVFYDNKDWWNSPLHSGSNINGVGTCDRKEAMTMQNGNLMEYQKSMITKFVTELEGYDNIFYEIINEPYLFDADNPLSSDPEMSRKYVHMDWQREMASAFNAAQENFPNKYLLAQNIDQFKTVITEGEGKLTDAIDSVSIFNFHYNARSQGDIDASIGDNYELNRPIACDETGNYENQSADEVYRKQGWNFLLAGGAVYNNLDFTFQVDYPAGDQDNPMTNFGGGASLRTQLGFLKSYFDSVNFINMEPYYNLPAANTPVVMSNPASIGLRCLAKIGSEYVIYCEEDGLQTMTLDLPPNNYVLVWTNPKDGTNIQTDNFSHSGGQIEVSTPVYTEDIVLRVSSNAAPSVDAGNDATIIYPLSSYTLQGVVSDDGLPENSTVSSLWTYISGPADVTFDDATSTNAIVTFSQTGTYSLRLTATDGELSAHDLVVIYYNSIDPPTGEEVNLIAHWKLDEQTGSVSYDNTENSNNGTLSSGFTFDNSSVNGFDGTALHFNGSSDFVHMGDPSDLDMGISNFSISAWVFIPEHKNTKQFILVKAADGSDGYGLRLERDNTIQGMFKSTNLTYYVGDNIPAENQWNLVVVVYDRTNGIFKIYLNGSPAGSSDIPSGSISNNKEFQLGAYFSGGTNKRFFAGSIDDVKIHDHALNESEILDLYIPSANSAPDVDAGPDQTIQMPNSAIISGTVSDDGLPYNTLTTTWSQFSGPGTVTFDDPSALNTTAQFSTAGVYRLSLLADDGELSSSNKVSIIVEEEVQSNLVAHWKFDETSGTNASDASPNQNDGTLQNMSFPENSVNGKFDGALSFDGQEEFVNFGDPADGSLDMSVANFTLTTWIYIPQHQNTKQFIIIKAADGSKGYGLRLENNNTLQGIINSNGLNVYCGNTVPTENEWHHAAVVFDRDNSEFILYLDGSVSGSSSIYDGTLANNEDFMVGTYFTNGMYKRFFSGYVDDIRIYDYALTSSDVQQLYNPYTNTPMMGMGGTGDGEDNGNLMDVNQQKKNNCSIINYPNPFTNQTTISFNVNQTTPTKVKVYNTLGMEVQVLFDEVALAGRPYKLTFNGNNLPEGIYFYTLQSGEDINIIEKMILCR